MDEEFIEKIYKLIEEGKPIRVLKTRQTYLKPFPFLEELINDVKEGKNQN